MDDQTEIITKDDIQAKDHSTIFNVSLRGWLCMLIVATVCSMSFLEKKIEEPLYTLVGMVVGYYFAQGNKPKTQNGQ